MKCFQNCISLLKTPDLENLKQSQCLYLRASALSTEKSQSKKGSEKNHYGLFPLQLFLTKMQLSYFGFLQNILKAFKNGWTERSFSRSQFVQFIMAKVPYILQKAHRNIPGLTAQSLAVVEAEKLITSWCSFCQCVVICI